jgi:hypothetical protein
VVGGIVFGAEGAIALKLPAVERICGGEGPRDIGGLDCAVREEVVRLDSVADMTKFKGTVTSVVGVSFSVFETYGSDGCEFALPETVDATRDVGLVGRSRFRISL